MPDPAPIQITRVTPSNPQHSLFNRVLNIVRADAEWIYVELKDGINYIESRFRANELHVVAPIPPSLPPSPVVTTAPPAVSAPVAAAPETVTPNA